MGYAVERRAPRVLHRDQNESIRRWKIGLLSKPMMVAHETIAPSTTLRFVDSSWDSDGDGDGQGGGGPGTSFNVKPLDT